MQAGRIWAREVTNTHSLLPHYVQVEVGFNEAPNPTCFTGANAGLHRETPNCVLFMCPSLAL